MESETNYTFRMYEKVEGVPKREVSYGTVVEDGAIWIEVLREFTKFLSSVYGYSIDDQIIVERYNYESNEKDQIRLRDYW